MTHDEIWQQLQKLQQLEADNARLREERDGLAAALVDAAEVAQSWADGLRSLELDHDHQPSDVDDIAQSLMGQDCKSILARVRREAALEALRGLTKEPVVSIYTNRLYIPAAAVDAAIAALEASDAD